VAPGLKVVRAVTLDRAGIGLGAATAPLGLTFPLGVVTATIGLGMLPAPLALMAVTVPPGWGTAVVLVGLSPTNAEDLPGPTRVGVGGSPTRVVP
jgi:hypothetical protein